MESSSIAPTLVAPAPASTSAAWRIPAVLIALGLMPTLAGVLRLVGLARGEATMVDHARFAADPGPAILHIVSATTFCMVGAFQFSSGFRRARPAWHRRAGRWLAPSGLLAALSGMWMTVVYPPAEHDGPWLRG